MQYHRLGSTNLTVSPIGMGLAALGRPGYINLGHRDDLEREYEVEAMRDRTFEVLDRGFAAGVRYFDAARSYGKGEAFLGQWLAARNLAPETVTVGSKWGYIYTADWQVKADKHEVKEHSLAVLQQQWHESNENLGTHLDVYQIHSATLDSGVLENSAVLKELARLKQNGVAVGLTVSGAQQGETVVKAIAVEVDGVRLFDTVQATWNLLEQSVGEALVAAKEQGLGIIIKEALANGRLTSRNPDGDQLLLLQREAARLNTSVDAMAIAAVVAQPWVDVVLSGAAKIEHLESNLRSLEVEWDERAKENLARLIEPADLYWQKRSALPWN